jgi:type 1 glutamine amidotransferase
MNKSLIVLWMSVLTVFKGFSKEIMSMENTYRKPPHIVFLISEDPLNYEAPITIPAFAKFLESSYGYTTSVLLGEGERTSYRFPGIEALAKADLLVVFCRRVALSSAQLSIIKNYLKKGKPVVGIRTANHAFSLLEEPAAGFEAWPGFVDSVLGCKNRGYGPVLPGTDVAIAPGATNHPVLKGIVPGQWHSEGNVYLVAPLLDEKATVLLNGREGENVQPVAWTRQLGRSRVFYTSMGYPDDFNIPQFRQLLINGIHWALKKKI